MQRYILILYITMLTFVANGKEIEVCPSCSISTITEAVRVASDGDVIRVKSGVYREGEVVVVDKSLTFVGEDMPVLDAENIGAAIEFHASNFSFEGFKVINVGQSYTKDFAAIYVSECKDFYIKNNVLENVFFGILIEKSNHGVIENNTVSGTRKKEANSGNGVHAWHSNHLTIKDNELFHMRDGIYFEFVKESEVMNNHSHHNIRYGLHFMFSNHDHYHDNLFQDNGAGVAVMFSKFINMQRNKFVHNWGSASYGLLLKEIYDAEIINNIFDQNTIGINVEGSTRINYTNNVFRSNGWAIKIRGACYENIFHNNSLTSNAFDLAFDGRMNDNDFNGNYWGNYTGYDLDKNGIGDVPYRPVKLFSYIVNQTPETIVLLRSLFVDIINFSEKVSPVFTPDNLLDNTPLMINPND